MSRRPLGGRLGSLRAGCPRVSICDPGRAGVRGRHRMPESPSRDVKVTLRQPGARATGDWPPGPHA